jgi:hypothetical protein
MGHYRATALEDHDDDVAHRRQHHNTRSPAPASTSTRNASTSSINLRPTLRRPQHGAADGWLEERQRKDKVTAEVIFTNLSSVSLELSGSDIL